MKMELLFAMLLLASVGVINADNYSKCIDHCKATHAGSQFDKQTERGACNKGCSAAHWTDKSKGVEQCYEEFDRFPLELACIDGSKIYGIVR